MITNPFIFIHIPKTGGSSITKYFKSNQEHRAASYYKKSFPRIYEKYLVFACTRNPWTRIVSSYFYQIKSGNSFQTKELFIHENPCFDTYLKNEYNAFLNSNSHIRTVLDWISEDNNIIVDYICNLHTIKKDFEFIRNIINRKDNLLHVNKSNHEYYKNYYKNDDNIKMVSEIFKKDIDYFKFNFDDKYYSDFDRVINKEKYDIFKKFITKKMFT